MQEVEDQPWSCLIACKISGAKFVTTFHGTYNFNSSIKKYYNSIMVKSDIVITGSKLYFSHIKSNYETTKLVRLVKRGIDENYFDPFNVEILKKKNKKRNGFF